MDVHRSFNKLTESSFLQVWMHALNADERCEALDRVLKALSLLISYNQGMNYIGAMFLLEVN